MGRVTDDPVRSSDDPVRTGFGTRAIHAATRPPNVEQQPDAVPIYQAVTFSAANADELADLLADRKAGYSYARLDNPTSLALAEAFAELEGGEAGYAFGSGMAAIHATLLSLLSATDHVVAARTLYGQTHSLLAGVLSRLGITTTHVDPNDLDAVAAAITDRTRVLYLETIANPNVVVCDLPALAELGHRHGLTVVVDNTFASPYLCRPLELGADLVVESCTKWLSGHSDVLAGAVAGRRDLVAAVRSVQIDTGGGAAPFSAFLVLRGMATLHVRMERHCQSALTLARHLEAAAPVAQVWYPGLASHPQFGIAQRLLRAGGGMLAFDLRTRAAAMAFLDALSIPPRTASLGSIHTICVHPASSTHRQLDAAELERAGIREGLVRVSVGLEDTDDLIADFERGLAAAAEAVTAVSV